MNYRELLRRRQRLEMYKNTPLDISGLTPQSTEERRHKEILDALHRQDEQIGHVAQKIERQNWVTDFLSDVGANILTDSLWLVGRRLLGKH